MMNMFKGSLAIMAAVVIVLGFGAAAFAFHSGGVAECEGCHSMHTPASTDNLLVGTDNSSTCLSCHEHAGDTQPSSYHISTASVDQPTGVAPIQRTPGGDFGWTKKDYIFVVRGETINEIGPMHGHDVNALDNGYGATNNPTAPGGTYAQANLACDSCHDKHGQYRRTDTGAIVKTGAPIRSSGSYNNSFTPTATEYVGVYRLLGGIGYGKDGGIFAVNPPMAVTKSSYNASEATQQIHTAYGSGMSEWCATCHPDMLSGATNHVHPVGSGWGNFSGTIRDNYNFYKKSGDMTGTQATSFNSLVPYEEYSKTWMDLKTTAASSAKVQAGPAGNAQAMCLSCHRAHASGWPEAIRWMYQYEFMTINGAYGGIDSTVPGNTATTIARGRTVAETQAAYYDRPATEFASYQRMLCNKCHAKD